MADNAPTQYPDDVAPGGLRYAAQGRFLRNFLGSVRQPYLGNPPAVQSTTGLGTGGGAYIRNNGSDADASQGVVEVILGINPSASGNIVLSFPVNTPAAAGGIFCAANWATLVVTQGNPLTIAWTGNAQDLTPNRRHTIVYQWNNST